MESYYLIDDFIETIMNLTTVLKGKKTYVVGLLMIVLGLLQADNQMVLEGLGLCTLRAGIGK